MIARRWATWRYARTASAVKRNAVLISIVAMTSFVWIIIVSSVIAVNHQHRFYAMIESTMEMIQKTANDVTTENVRGRILLVRTVTPTKTVTP
jgi:hypothetical protein